VQGVPSCSSRTLAALLKEWNYNGYTTSDTDAVKDSYSEHKYWKSASEASCRSITDGKCDINSGSTYQKSLLAGVGEKICSMADVDASVERTLRQRFDLGLFDPAKSQPLTQLDASSIATPAIAELNLKAAEESLVLLMNRDALLPLSRGTKMAVIGPFADDAKPQMGTHWKGFACPDGSLGCVPTIYDAIGTINNASGGTTSYAPGCGIKTESSADLAAAVATGRAADHIVLVLGIDDSIEHESHDRVSIDLPPAQHNLASAIYALGKPVIVVLINGGAVSIEQEMDSSGTLKKLAIIEAMLPGARGSEAIANGIFGHHGFGGRLPYSICKYCSLAGYQTLLSRSTAKVLLVFASVSALKPSLLDANALTADPASFVNTTAMSVMDPTVPPGRTYRYRDAESFLFPFGTGLSLSSVRLSLPGGTDAGTISTDGSNATTISVAIDNHSGPSVSQVITAYWVPNSDLNIAAKIQLFDFQRVHIRSGERQVVRFTISSAQFRTADRSNGDLVVIPGQYGLKFTDGGIGEVAASVTVAGASRYVVEKFPIV
jgi:hypothetical protein